MESKRKQHNLSLPIVLLPGAPPENQKSAKIIYFIFNKLVSGNSTYLIFANQYHDIEILSLEAKR